MMIILRHIAIPQFLLSKILIRIRALDDSERCRPGPASWQPVKSLLDFLRHVMRVFPQKTAIWQAGAAS